MYTAHRTHAVLATVNQRHRRWFNVATTPYAKWVSICFILFCALFCQCVCLSVSTATLQWKGSIAWSVTPYLCQRSPYQWAPGRTNSPLMDLSAAMGDAVSILLSPSNDPRCLCLPCLTVTQFIHLIKVNGAVCGSILTRTNIFEQATWKELNIGKLKWV